MQKQAGSARECSSSSSERELGLANCRGRHVADLVELTDDELAAYWRDIATASRALYAVFDPAQVNYLTYGNNVPHLHTYLLPRYLDDPSPGLPLQPFVETPIDAAVLQGQVDQLKAAAASDSR